MFALLDTTKVLLTSVLHAQTTESQSIIFALSAQFFPGESGVNVSVFQAPNTRTMFASLYAHSSRTGTLKHQRAFVFSRTIMLTIPTTVFTARPVLFSMGSNALLAHPLIGSIPLIKYAFHATSLHSYTTESALDAHRTRNGTLIPSDVSALMDL